MSFLIETIQNITLLLNRDSNNDSVAYLVQKESMGISCNASLSETGSATSADFNASEV